jgi:hypothetical protein
MPWLSFWKNIPHYLKLVVCVLLGIYLISWSTFSCAKNSHCCYGTWFSSQAMIKIHSRFSSAQFTSLQPISWDQANSTVFLSSEFQSSRWYLSIWWKCLMYFMYLHGCCKSNQSQPPWFTPFFFLFSANSKPLF